MNINQVRYFETVLEEGSFSAAARAQFVTVQAVSKAIADLERELGRALFIRENRCVRPTEFGLVFHSKALPALTAFESLESFAKDYDANEGMRSLNILLCAPAFPKNEVVVPNIATLLGKAIDVDVEMQLATVEAGLAALFSEQVDAIITIGTCSRQGVECVPVGTMQTAVSVQKTHPLATKQTVTIEDLNPYSALQAKEFDDFAESIMSLYRERGLTSPVTHVSMTEPEQNIVDFMSDGGYVFCASIPPLFSNIEEVRMIPIDSADAVAVPICICALKGKKVPAYKALVRMASNPAVLMSIM